MKNKVFCIGEILIDRYNINNKIVDKVAGAPLNVAIVLKHLKNKVNIAASIGNDKESIKILKFLNKEKFSLSNIVSYHSKTTIAEVSITDGERDFKFYRDSDSLLSINDINKKNLLNHNLIHFGSATAFLGNELLEAYDYCLEIALKNKLAISFDPNFRSNLYNTKILKNKFIDCSLKYIDYSNLIKLSEEEASIIFKTKNLEQAISKIKEYKNKVFLITLGSKGSLIIKNSKEYYIQSYPVKKVIDTTGAGDSFIGYVLSSFDKNMKIQDLKDLVYKANMFSSFVVKKIGLQKGLIDNKLVNNIFCQKDMTK